MNKVMMRLQCLEVSAQVKMKFAALKMTNEDIAEALASFASEAGDDGIEPRMIALKMAVDLADRRSSPAEVLNHARHIMEFAAPKPKPVPPKVVPKKSQPRRRMRGAA